MNDGVEDCVSRPQAKITSTTRMKSTTRRIIAPSHVYTSVIFAVMLSFPIFSQVNLGNYDEKLSYRLVRRGIENLCAAVIF